MSSTAVYEVYFKKILICRGYIEDVAESLSIDVKSARVYVSSKGRAGVEIVKLPALYEIVDGDNVLNRGTCEEVSYILGVSRDHVRRSSREEGRKCAGYTIRKFRYTPYMMDDVKRSKMLKGSSR